jgi:hypothetical protein
MPYARSGTTTAVADAAPPAGADFTGISRCVEDTAREASWPADRHADRHPRELWSNGAREGGRQGYGGSRPGLAVSELCRQRASGIAFLPVTGSCRRRRIVLEQERRPVQRHGQPKEDSYEPCNDQP